MRSRPPALFSGDEGEADLALTIGELYRRLGEAIQGAFPEELWVTGEIRSLSVSAAGHHYIDLVDHSGGARGGDAVLKVTCWRSNWPGIQRLLDRASLELEEGMVVRVKGRLSVWDGNGSITLAMTALDTEALLGRIAAERARVLAALAADGLLDRNRKLPLSLVPLKVGLVASPGTEGFRDFLGQLMACPFGFEVVVVPSSVQGRDAPVSLAAALDRLQDEELDVVVLVRGGGSKSDLAAFDAEAVVRAVAMSRHPVWVGIGHTGDRSLTDEVASRSFVTPTECGQALVQTVGRYWSSVSASAVRLARSANLQLQSEERRISNARQGLRVRARAQLAAAQAYRARCGATALKAARSVPTQSRLELARIAGALSSLPRQRLDRWESEVAASRKLLLAYDYRHQLARGYSITRLSSGRILRAAHEAVPGDRISTQLAEGVLHSLVEDL